MKFGNAAYKLEFFFVILSAALALLPAVAAQPQNKRQLTVKEIKQLPIIAKRFALVVGIDEYQDTQISRLSGATNDAKALADALVQYAGFPRDQVILLASDQPQERQPTRGNILRRLSNLRGLVPEDGLLLVSFAGHGIERNGRGFLCTSDAQINGDLALLEDTAISVETLRERIRQMGVKQMLIILDACRNDPSGRGDEPNRLTNSFAQRFNFDVRNQEVTAFATLYATDVGHVAYEYKEKHQGYFTYLLVEGLKGGAANERGEVTLGGLVKYLQEQVPKRIHLDLGQEKSQKPYATVGGYKADELVISITVNVTTGAGKPVESAVDTAKLELRFWDSIEKSSDPDDFKAYLGKYPNGTFATLARNKIRNLEATAKPTPSGDNPTFSKTLPPVEQHLKIGNLLAGEGKWAEAETEFRKAISLEPQHAKAHASLGIAFAQQKKLNEAESEYQKAVQIEPQNAQWRTLLGVFFFNQKKLAEAEKELKEAVRLEDQNARSHTNLGLVLEAQEKWNEAGTQFQEAVRLDPQNAEYQDYLNRNLQRKDTKEQPIAKLDPQSWTTKVKVTTIRNFVSSGIFVKRGDTISIKAVGTISYTLKGDNVNHLSFPNGVRSQTSSGNPEFALIAIIGENDLKQIFVGGSAKFIADREGILSLSISSGTATSSFGSYEAIIEVHRGK